MTRVLTRTTQFAAALLVLALLTARSQAGDGKEVYQSPQEVFDARRKAMEKEDLKVVVGCYTATNRDVFAGHGVKLVILVSLIPPEDENEQLAKYAAKYGQVLQQHGLTGDCLTKIAKEYNGLAGFMRLIGHQSDAEFRKLAAAVKDRDGFIVDFYTVHWNLKDMEKGALDVLKDVQLDGDSAKGVEVSTNKDGVEARHPIEFRREDGCWKIEVPPSELKQMTAS